MTAPTEYSHVVKPYPYAALGTGASNDRLCDNAHMMKMYLAAPQLELLRISAQMRNVCAQKARPSTYSVAQIDASQRGKKRVKSSLDEHARHKP